jgi:uncharacterized protein (DUF58 family)
MWWRRRSAPETPPAPVRLAPAQADALLRRTEWTVLRRLDGWLQGDHRSRQRGHGLDLADLREYQPSDDVRHIDWNVTARQGTPHVRVFHEDRDMVVWLLLDRSPSQAFGSGAQRKQELMRDVVLTLARWMGRHGNRVGAVVYEAEGSAPRVLPPRAGREQLLRLLSELERPTASPSGRGTQLATLVQRADALMRGRCSVALVSDFISAPGWERPLGQLGRRHDLLAVRLVDPLERQWPDIGLVTLTDPETGESLQVDTHHPGFRARFAQLANARELAVHEALAQAGADAIDLVTDSDWVASLARLASLRRARAAGRWRPAESAPHAVPAVAGGVA